jgi:two-component system, chemotaxis family, chemotaxis protein CheY
MSKTVMIIDDSALIRKLVRIALQPGGYGVIEAGDGAEALAKLQKEHAELVICDVNMPVMDGFTFLKEVKKDPRHRFVPVIMLTTETRESYMREGQMGGAKAWIVKPFRPEQILAAVGTLLSPPSPPGGRA